MQLILDTENRSVNLNEKMSSIDQEIVDEKLPNGDIKENVGDLNRHPEKNSTIDKDDAHDKENILNNCDEFRSHNESENIEPEKPNKEHESTAMEKNGLSADNNEIGKCILEEAVVQTEEKLFPDSSVENKVSRQCDEDEDLLCSKENKTNEDKLDNYILSELKDNIVPEKAISHQKDSCSDDEKHLLIAMSDNFQNNIEKSKEDPQQDKIETEAEKMHVLGGNIEVSSNLQSCEDLKLNNEPEHDDKEKLVLDINPPKSDDVEKNKLYNPPEAADKKELDNDELEHNGKVKIVLDIKKQPDVKIVEKNELCDPSEADDKKELVMQELINIGVTVKQELIETENKQSGETETYQINQTDDSKQDCATELDSNREEFAEIENKETALKEQKETLVRVDRESDLLNKVGTNIDIVQKPFSAIDEDDEMLSEGTENDISKEKDTQKNESGKSTIEDVEAMDVDKEENIAAMDVDLYHSIDNEQDSEDMTETDVTQSISKMVENIVQKLNDNTSEEMIENIETATDVNVQKNKKEQVIDSHAVKEFTDKTEASDTFKQATASSTPEINNKLEKEQHITDVDAEAVTQVPQHPVDASHDCGSKIVEQLDDSLLNKAVLGATIDSNNGHIIIDANLTSPQSDKSAQIINIACSEVNKTSVSDNIETPQKSDKSVKGSHLGEGEAITSTEKDNAIVIDNEETDCQKVDKIINCEDSSITNIENKLIAPSDKKKTQVENVSQDNALEISEPKDCTVSGDKEHSLHIEGERLNKETENISKMTAENEKTLEKVEAKRSPIPLIKLSNTMDILSDEEDELKTAVNNNDEQDKNIHSSDKQCINLDDDDDIFFIEDDINKEDKKENSGANPNVETNEDTKLKKNDIDTHIVDSKFSDDKSTETVLDTDTGTPKPEIEDKKEVSPLREINDTIEAVPEKPDNTKSLIPGDFFKSYRKNLTDMTRDDLEEFCILKIVESIIDRSNLNEIRSKLKTMGQTIEEYKKKATLLTKQNRDLQVVLKSVQEEQKKSSGLQPITPLKITRSVGMQVLMTDKTRRRAMPGPANAANNVAQANRNIRNTPVTPQNSRNTPQKPVNNQTYPTPKLVPAGSSSFLNKIAPGTPINNVSKVTAASNGVKIVSPAPKPEKRTHSRMQSQSSSVTVDLTDDEPPSKIATKTSPAPPVRLVNPQTLLAPRQQFTQQVNSPRKVYIPISINGPQPPTVRPGQTIMVKTVSTPGPRARGPAPPVLRAPSNVPIRKVVGARHPAPLPDAMKQYQPPNWKSLPPAPDLKLSKVENGIVISWKIEGYHEDSYEEIASYQLYAYQETSAPPSTSLWKKIGDVKALPLPMACTLTQFMAGYKYYFAVRAVDIRSRLGPFSLPGSILLLNKM